MDRAPADTWWLLQASAERPDSLRLCATALARAAGARLHRAAWCADTGEAHLYLRRPSQASALDASLIGLLQDQHCPELLALRASPLDCAFDTAGAAAGQPARFHYVVETDPEPGWADEIARWYDTEHMPGLAAVPGCIRAMRFLNRGHGPLSLACYDLISRETLGSPPWLAVRGTAWSDRARPHFTNTRRTMFEVIVPH